MDDLNNMRKFDKNEKKYVLLIFKNGLREVWEITFKPTVETLEDVIKYGKFTARDYNGHHPNPPPLLPDEVEENRTCKKCKYFEEIIENINRREKELDEREAQLDKELKFMRSKSEKNRH